MNIIFSSQFKKFCIAFIVFGMLIVGIFLAWPGTVERLDIISSNPHPLIRHFAPTWRSIKRIVDLPYVFLYVMRGHDLPIYEITLSKKDKETLFENLPDYPHVYAMWDTYKKTVKGEFRADGYYTNDAKIRIRGVSPAHWNAAKKSWLINLPDEEPFSERTSLRLFIPEERGWILDAMNSSRAQELGVLSPHISYVWLRINSVDMGIYLLVEGWEESFLERNGRGLAPLFSNRNIDIRDTDLFRPDSISLWENRFETETSPASIKALEYFLDLVANAPDDVFARELPSIVDMDRTYRWLTITVLSGSFHQSNTANQNWYFNPATGKLEPVLSDPSLTYIENEIHVESNRLASRILQNPEFNAAFTAQLREYISDNTHKKNTLAFYDETYKQIRRNILSDTKKIKTSASILRHIQELRGWVEHNYDELQRMLDETGHISFIYADESYPLSKPFDPVRYQNSFLAHGTRLSDFLRKNPQFTLQQGNIITLPAGTHIFKQTIIIPNGYTLRLDPGASLSMGPDVSLISYSRVESIGTRDNPITIQSLDSKKPWGVFAVLNTPGTNEFRYTHIQDGGEATFASLYFSGSLSLRSSDLDFQYGSVTRSHADDGIHVYGSRASVAYTHFEKTSMDSIDMDFAKPESILEHNSFHASGGDAIDLSFSDTLVRENTITTCLDKGISIGEASKPIIEKNTIMGCAYGIAVKDKSYAHITNNLILGNETGIGLYRKKPHFVEGGRAEIQNTIIWDNKIQISADAYSFVTVTQSTVQNGYAGAKNSSAAPPLHTLLSKELFTLLEHIKASP